MALLAMRDRAKPRTAAPARVEEAADGSTRRRWKRRAPPLFLSRRRLSANLSVYCAALQNVPRQPGEAHVEHLRGAFGRLPDGVGGVDAGGKRHVAHFAGLLAQGRREVGGAGSPYEEGEGPSAVRMSPPFV